MSGPILSASSGRSLFSRLDRKCDMEAHIVGVIDQLRANRKGFIDLASKYEIGR